MDKEQRLTLRVENLDNNRLKGEVKIVNEIGKADKIRLVGIKKMDMVNQFTVALEKIAAEDENLIPDTCSTLYNELHTDEASPLDSAPKKDTKAKDTKKKESGDTKKSGPPKKPVNEYGVREGTLAFTFVEEVKKKAQTMEDVRKADWNPRGYHFNDTLRRLVADKKATVDEKTQVITIK